MIRFVKINLEHSWVRKRKSFLMQPSPNPKRFEWTHKLTSSNNQPVVVIVYPSITKAKAKMFLHSYLPDPPFKVKRPIAAIPVR